MAGSQTVRVQPPHAPTRPHRAHLNFPLASPDIFLIYLVLFSYLITVLAFTFLAISRHGSLAGRSFLQMSSAFVSKFPSLKEFGNKRRKGKDFRDRKRQERKAKGDEGKGRLYTARLSDVLSPKKRLVEAFARVLPKLKRSQSGWPKRFGKIYSLAFVWAVLHLPTGAAAYELKKDDVATGYGAIPAGTVLLMALILALRVRNSMQKHRKSLRESVRRPLERLWYVAWVTGVLATMFVVLAPTFNDVNEFETDKSTIELSCLGFAIFFAALISFVGGKCRSCGKSPCACPTGSGGGGTASLAATAV